MENIDNKTVDLATHIEEFAETWYKLTVLNAKQKATNLASAGITMIILFIAAIFVLLLATLALSWWLGDLIESRAGGFLLGAGFFVIVMAVVLLLRKRLLFPYFRDLIIRKLYD